MRQFPVPTHTSAPVPHAPARLLQLLLCCTILPRHVVASSRKHSAICVGVGFLTFIGHVALVHGQHMVQNNKDDACRMRVAECLWLLAATPRHRLPFLSNIVPHSSEVHAMHAAAKHGALAMWCACARGTGAQVCMFTGRRRPCVHVQCNAAEALITEITNFPG